jgi:hypothetical protein
MVAGTTRATGCIHLGMWCVWKYPMIYGCNLWQSLGWLEWAPSTKPCALKALDPPLKGGLITNSLFQCPSGTVRCPSRTLCSRHRNYPWCTPYTTATSHSNQYLLESGQGQGKSPELLTSPPPTWDSPLPSCIKPRTSWGCLTAKPHPPTTSSNIHHTSHIREYM